VHDIAAFKFVKVVSSTIIGWVWQFTLQSAQRHNQISKISDIFEKISTVNLNQSCEISSKKRRCEVVIKEYGDIIISFQH
jgi:hypothetical protein